MALSEEITYDTKKSVRNEYDFRRELLSALEVDFSSNNEVKDTEIYRQHILHALGQEFDQDDIKQINNFRAKVVDGVKELVNGGGGGSGFPIANITINVSGLAEEDYATVSSNLIGTAGQWSGRVFGMYQGRDDMWFSTAWSQYVYNGTETYALMIVGDNIGISVQNATIDSITGNATMDSYAEGVVRVTGDCTINITGN